MPNNLYKGLMRLLRRFTIDQWLIIGAEYSAHEKRTGAKGVIALIFATLLLIIRYYYGQPKHFTRFFGNVVADWQFFRMLSRLYTTSVYLILYLLMPYLFIRLVLHERLKDHGFTLKGTTRYIWLYLAMFAIVAVFVIPASFFPSFIAKYPLYSGAGDSWSELIIWELNYGLIFVLLEFFFRGFMLFVMARCIGAYAVFVMVIPYAMVHFGKPFAETISSIIAGMALGTLALRTRSIFGGVFIHVGIAWLMDILALLQKGQLQNLIHK